MAATAGWQLVGIDPDDEFLVHGLSVMAIGLAWVALAERGGPAGGVLIAGLSLLAASLAGFRLRREATEEHRQDG